jgi:dipeptidyl-peptidase 4
MKAPQTWAALLRWAASLATLPTLGSEMPEPKDTFLHDYTETRGFTLGQPVKPQPTPDGRAVLFLRAAPRNPSLSLYEFDVASGETRELANPQPLRDGGAEQLSAAETARRERRRVSGTGFTDFELSRNGTLVLLPLGGGLFLLDRGSGTLVRLRTRDGTLLDPKFAPDGRKVAYVLDQDLRVYDLETGRERAVTEGGSAELTHGLAEFVAQEEMDRFSGYWWSPDSRWIAYQEADATGVERWQIPDPFKPDQPPHAQFYPRPGRENVKTRVGIVPARGGKTRWFEWNRAHYPYLARVDWHERAGLTLTVQSRDQTELALLGANPRTGETRVIWIEHDPSWVNLDQEVPRWLADGSAFLWTSEREGAWQLEVRDAQGQLLRVLVPAGEGYQGLLSVDETAGLVYYRASPDPRQSHLYRVPLAGGDRISLTAGRPSMHRAVFARNHSILVHTTVSLEAPTESWVRRTDFTPVGELPSVAETPPFVPTVQMRLVGAKPGFWTKLVRPRRFEAGLRYPVVLHVYGGPHAQMVQAELGDQWLDQWLADQGFLVVAADGRGTPGRGRDWERALHGAFAEVPLTDQIAALQALGREFPELGLERVGIQGWSFGGYLAALGALRRPDVFKAAVAGAPVTDWLDYDTHYTERYLGVPTNGEDAVYRRNSLIEDAPRLRVPLLLVHGTADDNVFFRHSLKLADALLRAGRPFEVLPLAGFTHRVPDPVVMERLWQRRAEFFHRHLGGPRPREATDR